VVFLGDEIVEAGLCLEEQGVQRPLRSIVRMKVELTAGWDRGWRLARIAGREGKTAKASGNYRRRGSLAAAEEKIPAARVYGIKIGRMTRLPCPTQSGDPRILTCRTEI
jgi:hypothetical protein